MALRDLGVWSVECAKNVVHESYLRPSKAQPKVLCSTFYFSIALQRSRVTRGVSVPSTSKHNKTEQPPEKRLQRDFEKKSSGKRGYTKRF